jgi:ABC-type multidrug transport system ATPase subunit
MNESILEALIRLFALVADVNRDSRLGNERDVVMDYLERQYSAELVQTYIDFFDEQVMLYHPEGMHSSAFETQKQHVFNESQIAELCDKINEELVLEQKLIVLVYLLDFINRGERLTENESRFISIVAESLKIDHSDFLNAKAFTFGELEGVVNRDCLLFIDGNDSSGYPDIKHMRKAKMEGRIVVLHFQGANIFVFRYDGHLSFFLNGHNIKPNRSYIWSSGSVIKNPKIGSLYYTRVAGKFIQANVESKFIFTAEDIEFNYRNSTNGIKRFNFSEQSGRLICIIGGSGSGKSTLLNLLNGNLKPKQGRICINGHDIHEEKEALKGVIGYVPQDDLLIKELTVFQNLYFNARLCFRDYSEAQLKEVVENALIDFDLVEARDLNVGDAFTTILSGGQRKRLNIALELIREPSILFIDEPTSGLSSADSEKVINLLKRQTLKGKLVITNIHQPSSDIYKMLDKLLVMDQGGRIVYYGNPIEGISYFKRQARYVDAEESECLTCGNINADQILRTVEARVVSADGRLTRKRKTTPQEWYDLYLKNIDVNIKRIEREHDSSIPKNNFKVPGRLEQFKIYFQRDVMSKFYNKQYLLLNALEAPVLAVLLAFFAKSFTYVDGIPRYVFGENTNIPSYLFMAVIVSLFLGLVISAEEVFKDRKILNREKFLNLSRGSYLSSKIAILFTISAIQALLFVLIGNYILEIKGMLFRYWLILFTTSCWANVIGLNISAGLNSVVTIYILVPLILVPQLLFSGVVVEFNKMHDKIGSDKFVPIVGDMITSRWAYEALMVTQFKDNRFERNFFDIERNIQTSIYYRTYCLPELFRLNKEALSLLKTKEDNLKLSDNLKVIQDQVMVISKELDQAVPAFCDSISSPFYSLMLSDKIENYFIQIDKYYKGTYLNATLLRDNNYRKLISKLGNDDGFINFKKMYHNNAVADVVTNQKEISEFVIHQRQIIPVSNAIYRSPMSNVGRAHFYAPEKRLGSMVVDTFWFNLIIIWLYAGFLFFFLYFDVLKRIISYFETLRLNRANQRRFLRLLNISNMPVQKK